MRCATTVYLHNINTNILFVSFSLESVHQPWPRPTSDNSTRIRQKRETRDFETYEDSYYWILLVLFGSFDTRRAFLVRIIYSRYTIEKQKVLCNTKIKTTKLHIICNGKTILKVSSSSSSAPSSYVNSITKMSLQFVN